MLNLKSERFSYSEELANAISHLVGAVLGIVALVFMLKYSIENGTVWHIVSALVFGASMVLLYLSSTMNHILPLGKAKDFFFNFDKIAIYLLIAGTYTPFALVSLHGIMGWVIFGIEWGLALTGILIIVFKPSKFEKSVNYYFIISYLVMGFIMLIAIPQFVESMGMRGFAWVLLGGFFYTAGILFFKLEKIPYNHLIWHVMVLLGTIAHFVSIYFFVLPVSLS